MRLIHYILLFSSISSGGTPINYAISFGAGYDDNVMRFSKNEIDESANQHDIMGNASTFDSYINRLKISADKTITQMGKKSLVIRPRYSYSDYVNISDKQYWSGGLDILLRWGSYKNIKYSLRHLDKFYLRHYTDRDISIDQLSACLFSDRNQGFTITHPLFKKSFINLGFGYLQRYYENPFQEFDIDIRYLKGKYNHRFKRFGTFAVQVNIGRAKSDSHHAVRPSSFDRSYRTIEWYSPIRWKKGVPYLNEIGLSIRSENRLYDAEDLNDPLRSGRSHLDSKLEVWMKKEIMDYVNVTLSTRYRKRSTNSEFSWVEDLKSFRQIQFWFNIQWELVYDNY